MINGFLDPYVERLKPVLESGTLTVQAYADRIVARLDQIRDAVETDETINVRRRFPIVVNAANGLKQEFTQVPTDQDWLLESVTADYTAALSVRLTSGDGGPVIWGDTVAGASVKAYSGNGAMVGGGNNLVVSASADGVILYLQFRYQRRKAKHAATNAGVINQAPDRDDSRTEASEDFRHAGTAQWAGNNVTGERHQSHPI